METAKHTAIIEAVLFAWGDPLDIGEIRNLLGLSEKEMQKVIESLKIEYEIKNRGIEVVKIGNKLQLTTKKMAFPYIKKLLPGDRRRSLSRATIETLTIIAYKQPITKSQIEKIRGVKCDKPLANLLQENLIYEKDRLDTIGRPIIYATTDFFLKKFGFETLDGLPDLECFEKNLDALKDQQAE